MFLVGSSKLGSSVAASNTHRIFISNKLNVFPSMMTGATSTNVPFTSKVSINSMPRKSVVHLPMNDFYPNQNHTVMCAQPLQQAISLGDTQVPDCRFPAMIKLPDPIQASLNSTFMHQPITGSMSHHYPDDSVMSSIMPMPPSQPLIFNSPQPQPQPSSFTSAVYPNMLRSLLPRIRSNFN